MSNKIFEYKLWRENETTYFQVLKQPEEWRGKETIYITRSGFNIMSRNYPSLVSCPTKIYLRGRSSDDDNFQSACGCTESEHNRISSALSEFSAWANGEDKQVREVKRHAKVGEYIKLTQNDSASNAKADMIFKIIDGTFGIVGTCDKRLKYNDSWKSNKWYFSPGNYVVLENYTPEQPKPTQHRFEYALSRWYGATLFKVIRMPEEWSEGKEIYTSTNNIRFITSYTSINPYEESIAINKYGEAVLLTCTKHFHHRIASALIEFQVWADKENVK